jgi:hypothetical protein
MIQTRVVVILRGMWAELDMTLPAVPRVGEYVVCRGTGELGWKVFSVIYAADHVTLQVRELDVTPTAEHRQEMAEAGWTLHCG